VSVGGPRLRYHGPVGAATELELVEAWRGGDAAAGRALFARYFDRLHRFFSSKVSQGVEDLIQDTLLACVEGRGTLQRSDAFATFLFGVARRRLYRKWRDEHRGANAIDFGLTSVTDLGMTPSDEAAQRESRRRVVAAMQRIPVELQIALELFYWEDMSASEVAKVLDLPEGTVRSRLRRARSLLEQQLQRAAA
jgi:RNA polymerase sigma factor (sigma-70 family)